MRRRLISLALVAAVLLAAALRDVAADGSTSAGPRSSPLTGPELRWIRGYSRWAIEVDDARAAPAARRRLRGCAAVLRTDAGPAPTPRIRAAESHVHNACAAAASGSPDDVVDDQLGRADDQLWPLLLVSAPVRETDDATSESRRSTLLGAVASARAGAEVDVQCWSPRDWLRVIREEAAWTDSENNPGLTDGLANPESGRIELLLEDCNLLGRLGDEQIADRNREGLIAAAEALSTFSHEIQHFRHPDATEAEVECAGVEYLADVGRALGVDGRENDLLHSVYEESIHPDLPGEYVRAC